MRKSVFGILVVAVTVTILLAGSTAVTADHAPIEEDHNQTPYGMSNADFAQLWSYVEPYENSTLDNMEFESASTEYALGSDWSTTQPPDTANTWNKTISGISKAEDIQRVCIRSTSTQKMTVELKMLTSKSSRLTLQLESTKTEVKTKVNKHCILTRKEQSEAFLTSV